MNKLKQELPGLGFGRFLGAIWEFKSDPTRVQILKQAICTKSYYLQYETPFFDLTYGAQNDKKSTAKRMSRSDPSSSARGERKSSVKGAQNREKSL